MTRSISVYLPVKRRSDARSTAPSKLARPDPGGERLASLALAVEKSCTDPSGPCLLMRDEAALCDRSRSTPTAAATRAYRAEAVVCCAGRQGLLRSKSLAKLSKELSEAAVNWVSKDAAHVMAVSTGRKI